MPSASSANWAGFSRCACQHINTGRGGSSCAASGRKREWEGGEGTVEDAADETSESGDSGGDQVPVRDMGAEDGVGRVRPGDNVSDDAERFRRARTGRTVDAQRS